MGNLLISQTGSFTSTLYVHSYTPEEANAKRVLGTRSPSWSAVYNFLQLCHINADTHDCGLIGIIPLRCVCIYIYLL